MNDLFAPVTEAEKQAKPIPAPVVLNALARTLALPDGIYYDIPEEIYHQLPYCSSTYLRKLLINPAEAQAIDDEEKKTMIFGRAVHALTLEGEQALAERFAFLPSTAPKKPTRKQVEAKKPSEETLKAIEWWDGFTARNAGKSVMSADDETLVHGCARAIFADPWAGRMLSRTSGQPEITVIITDPVTGLRCKIRMDRMDTPKRAPIDLKTISDAKILSVQRSISKYHYVTQFGFYTYIARLAGLEADNFIACFVQSKPTHLVCSGMIEPEKLEGGILRAMKALKIEQECRLLGFYPNIEIPQEVNSLFEIYREDGTIKNDALLFHVFDPPEWGI